MLDLFPQGRTESPSAQEKSSLLIWKVFAIKKKLTSSCYDDLSQVVSIKREIKGKCYSLEKKDVSYMAVLKIITDVHLSVYLTAAFWCVLDRMLWIWTWLLCRALRSTHNSSVRPSVGAKLCHL